MLKLTKKRREKIIDYLKRSEMVNKYQMVQVSKVIKYTNLKVSKEIIKKFLKQEFGYLHILN